VEKPPPVVDGVRRTNVGSAHSPQLQQQLSRSPATIPPPADAGARGVDVASYQHPHGAAIDWSRVAAAGYKFAFIKATEGDYYVNPYYAADLAQAKAAGLYATGYHFAVPNVSGGASQAEYAVRNGDYTADGRTLPLALDIEYNPYGAECYGLSAARMVAWVSAFTTEVQRLTGQRPIIYTTADWWHTCTGGSTAFGSDPLWVAGWGSSSPPMPAGWRNWTFWQYTSRGSVPGITGDVDISYFLSAAVRLLDPGNQRDAAGTAIRLQVRSLNATDGQSPHFTASHLPSGLSINGRGLITGTISPTASGTYGVTVTATNPSGGTGSVSFTWTVTSSQPSPSPSPPPSRSPSPSPSPEPPSKVA
jgi:GH25 family lysozyme M1 (1,4-beta-N-acetylmuramidase)